MPAPPVEYSLLDMAPSLPTDDAGAWAAAFVYLAWGLSGNWDQELLRTAIAERLGPDEVGVLLPPLPADPPSIPAGSLARSPARRAPAPEGRGVERLGGGGHAHGDRQAAARERPAPARRAARRVDRDAPPRSRVRGARRGAHVLARHPARHDGAPRVGRHERERRRPGPLRRASERRAHGRRARRRVGAADRPSRRDPRPRSRRTGRRRRPRDATRPDHRDGRGGQHAHRAHPARIGRDVRAPVDGVRLRHPSVARPGRRERDQLRGVPPRGVGRGVPGSELRLRRRGRHDRLSMLGTVPAARRRRRHRARARMDRRVRVERMDPVRRAAVGGRSRRTGTWSRRTTGSTTTATRT